MARKIKTTDQAVIRPAIYLRVSTQEQADSGLGLGAQRARCTGMCDAKGWGDAVIFTDEGISGTLGPNKRPGLALLLAAIEAGKVNALVVLDLSRLGRNTRLVLDLLDTIDQAGASFVSVKEGFDTSTATGRFVLTMFAALAQLERDQTSERTIAALGERGKAHGYKAGRLPYGYQREVEYQRTKEGKRTIVSERIVIDHQAAMVIERIDMLRKQGLPLRDIAFDVSGIADPPKGGERWYASAIKVILDNMPIYRGEVEHWPRILI